MVLQELKLDSAISVRRALRAGVFVCASALWFFGRPSPEVSLVLYVERGLIVLPASLSTRTEFLLTLGWLNISIVGTAIVGVGFTLFRLIVRHTFAGTLIELALATAVLVLVILFQGVDGYGVLTLGVIRPLTFGVGITLFALQVSIIYAFLYPRRDDAVIRTVAAVLHGSAGRGPERVIEHGVLWFWLIIVGALCTPLSNALLSSAAPRVQYSFLLVAIAWRALIPGLVAFARKDVHRTLHLARHRRRLQRYSWYVLTTSLGRSRLRTLCVSVLAVAILAALIWLVSSLGFFGALIGVSLLHQFSPWLRQGLVVLADQLPGDAASQIEESGVYTLYLRSFDDDEFQLDLSIEGWRRLLFLGPSGRIYEESFRSSRLEELVVTTLWRHRPVLAVKSVGVLGKAFGAVQIPLAHADWQGEVDRLAHHAQSVVTVLAVTAGLRWEAGLLMADGGLRRRTAFVVPPGEQPDIVTRWRNCFGEMTPGDETVVAGALVTKPVAQDGMVVITAARRTAAAYRMALEVAEALVARDSAAASDREELVQ